MKKDFCMRFLVGVLAGVALLSSWVWTHASLPQEQDVPRIISIQTDGQQLLLRVEVPPGSRVVTVESRRRVDRGGWVPRAVAHLTEDPSGPLTFRLPMSEQMEVVRVRVDWTAPLPASFYQGTNQFFDQVSGTGYYYDLTPVAGPFPETRVDAGMGPTEPTREVVESDIYKIRGQTLYYFNQYRGLQIIDLSDPDAPVLRGTWTLPAAGEQMYTLGERHVVLLVQQGCGYGVEAPESAVLILEDVAGTPEAVAELPVPGRIVESRMVGTALYVASQTYRPVVDAERTTWEWGTLVSAFDLADPTAPEPRTVLWYPGYGHVVSATPQWLFVVTVDPSDSYRSLVHVIDITAPDGTMGEYTTIPISGRVPDKFKLHYQNQVFTCISEDRSGRTGRRLVTRLETFRLPDPRSLGPMGVVKLGELELGRGERLHATRFDGDRVYVVTFFQIDPLWVVDLSDPSRPRLAGHLEVPGWSTYIEPLGDRLVAVGVETGRVAVSLFDVSDTAHPALLSKVLLGESYSWSEANSDEKAFSVFPDEGLVLVPYSGNTTDGYAQRVQLLDLTETKLVARGVIEHAMQPRRATLYGDRILSFSSAELITVEAADRDHPEVRATLELAWPVERVAAVGDYIVQVSGPYGLRGESEVVLRVAAADDPEHILTRLTLTDWPVLGVTRKADRLYIAQGLWRPIYWVVPLEAEDDGEPEEPKSKLLLSVVDLSALPELRLVTQVETSVDIGGWGARLEPLWVKPDLLVWSATMTYYPWYWYRGDIALGAPMAADARFIGPIMPPWPYYVGTAQLLAYRIEPSGEPVFASSVSLARTNRWSFSSAYTAAGLVFLSHQTSEFIPEPDPDGTDTSSGSGRVISDGVKGTWIWRSYLNVVDYADPVEPVVRKPVSIPGRLIGLGHEGALLYTMGPRWENTDPRTYAEYVFASAYDGVAAHLVDELPLPSTWPHPVTVLNEAVYLGRPAETVEGADSQTPPSLEVWQLSSAGQFEQVATIELSQTVSELVGLDALLLTRLNDNTLQVWDVTQPGAPVRVGEGRTPGCLWHDLRNVEPATDGGIWLPLGNYGVWHLAPAVQ